MKIKRSKVLFLVLILSVTGLFCGCAAKELEAEINHTTVVFNADGTVYAVFIEDFSQSYYSADGLKTMVEQEIADYNSANGVGKLSLNECNVTGNTARVKITYASVQDFAAYQGTDTFIGTIAEATAAGYDLNTTLTSPKDGTQIGVNEITQMSDKHILIMEDAPRVRVYKKILYIGGDIGFISNYEADATENAEISYLIFN